MRISRLEWFLVITGFIGLWISLAIVAGGPVNSDEVWYMQVGLNNIKDPLIINRYFHIYLQKLFMILAPNPLIGVKIFWGFLVSLTALFIYLCARSFTGTSFIHGLVASSLFFCSPLIPDNAGVTLVDFTAMMMGMLFIFLYLLINQSTHLQKWGLMTLGLVFFLGFKSKETILPFGILFFGLELFKDNKINIRAFWKKFRFVLLGIVFGFILFLILNSLFLGDPLFGFTPGNVEATLETVTNDTYGKVGDNYYLGYLFPVVSLTLILFLVSGFKTLTRFDYKTKLLWLLPLVIIAFLSLAEWTGALGMRPRYLLPALPVMCFLSPQFLDFEFPRDIKDKIIFVLTLLLSAIVLFILHKTFIAASGNSFLDLYNKAVSPILFSALLGTILLFNRYTSKTIIIPLVLIIGLAFYTLNINFTNLYFSRPAQVRFNEKIYPLSSFSQNIHYRPNIKVYFSRKIYTDLNMLSVNRDELMSLFNVFFDANSVRDNFIIQESRQELSPNVFQRNFDYIFLTGVDWDEINNDAGFRAQVEGSYEVYKEQTSRIVLLKQRLN